MARKKQRSKSTRSYEDSEYGFTSSFMQPDINQSCRGKCTYETVEEAQAVAVTNSGRSGRKIEVYKCPACGFYHLTSSRFR